MRRFTLLTAAIIMISAFISCATHDGSGENPLLAEWDTPFGVPPFEQIKPEHYMPAFEAAVAEHNAEIEAIIQSDETPTFQSVMLPYDNSGITLSEIMNVYSMISSAETNEELQAIEEEIYPRYSSHIGNIELNDSLFLKIKAAYDNRLTEGLDAEQLRLTEKIYTSFVRGGALLDAEAKKQLHAINEELSLLEVRFNQNLLAENNSFRLELTKSEIEGLPTTLTAQAKDAAQALGLKDRWVFTLQAPSWIPFLTYSKNRDLREKLYKAYISRGDNNNENDNKNIINDLVRLRSEKAHLLGYTDYANYIISDQMAGKSSKAYELLNEIWEPALMSAKEELAEMEALFNREHHNKTFESWDWWYYAESVRKKKYNFDEETLRPYFSLSNVQNGAFMLANRLYGITFRPIAVPRYHEECSAFEVLDIDESHIGILYFDYHPRPGKSQGAWCGNYREQRYENGERIAPVVSIVCNFSRPSGNTPALLTVDEVKTLFHEFGHSLHFLFHDVKYRGLTEVEGDFVELPSQIMENWAMEPELLTKYAFHHRNNNVISKDLIDKIHKSSLFNQGFATTELVAAALSDLDIHSITEYEPFDIMAFESDALTTRRGLIPQIEPRYHYPYFAHIFGGGYSAGYYFYLWAEVLDKDAFSAFKESGDLFNKKLAASFRSNVLERGGSESGMEMYTKFRGAEPNKDAMLRSRGLIEPPVVEQPEEMALAADSTKRVEPTRGDRAIQERPRTKLSPVERPEPKKRD